MGQQTQLEQVTTILESLLQQHPAVFLVSIRVKPTNNIKIFLDADDGLSIEKCIKINRALYRQMEELGIYPDGDFSLEVSSPGVDEPLKLLRQYNKNVGRIIEVILNDGTQKEGVLQAVTDEGIVLEEKKGKGKKIELVQTGILFSNIKQTTVQVKF